MAEEREHLPGDEILHPWSSSIVVHTLLRAAELQGTGTEQEKKWRRIAKNIYKHMSTRHDVMARVLQSYFFSEHSCQSNSKLKEVMLKLQEISRDVRRHHHRLLYSEEESKGMEKIKEGNEPEHGRSSSTTVLSSSLREYDEVSIAEEVDFFSRFVEEEGAFTAWGGVSLCSLLSSVTRKGREIFSSPSSAHSSAGDGGPHLSILGQVNPLTLAFHHYCQVEEQKLRDLDLHLGEAHRETATLQKEEVGGPSSSSHSFPPQATRDGVEEEKQRTAQGDAQLSYAHPSYLIHERIEGGVRREIEENAPPLHSTPVLRCASCAEAGEDTSPHNSKALPCLSYSSADHLQSSSFAIPSRCADVNASTESSQGQHFSDRENQDTSVLENSSFVDLWWERAHDALLVPLLFSSEPWMRESVKAYLTFSHCHHHHESLLPRQERALARSGPSVISSSSSSSSLEVSIPSTIFPTRTVPLQRSEEERGSFKESHSTILSPPCTRPPPIPHRTTSHFPSFFPFGVAPLHERRAAALAAEESRVATTLIRLEPHRPVMNPINTATVEEEAQDHGRPSHHTLPLPWQVTSMSSEDSSSRTTSPPSSADDEEEKIESRRHLQILPYKEHFNAVKSDKGRKIEGGKLGEERKEEGEKGGESNTTFIEHGEFVVANGSVYLRPIEEKKKRKRKRDEESAVKNIQSRNKKEQAITDPSSALLESGVPPRPPSVGTSHSIPLADMKTDEGSHGPILGPSLVNEGHPEEPLSPTSLSVSEGAADIKAEEPVSEVSSPSSLSFASASSPNFTFSASSNKGDGWKLFQERLRMTEKKSELGGGGEILAEEEASSSKKGTTTAKPRRRAGAEGGTKRATGKKRNSQTTSKPHSRSRSASSFSAVSVEGVPKITREEMKEILISNAWPQLTRILREAFLIAVEEPMSDPVAEGDNQVKEEKAELEEK